MDTTVNFFSSTCTDTKSYNLSNEWSKKKFLKDTREEGGVLYKLVPPTAVDAGIYAHKSSRTCTAEGRVNKLESELTELRAKFDAYIVETEQREYARDCDNTLSDCISDIYEMIVQKVHETNPSILTWQLLVRQARNNPTMQNKIETIYRDMGFTDAQWNALRSFKHHRNGSSHCSGDYVQKASVLVAECLDNFPPELGEALQHVITLLQ